MFNNFRLSPRDELGLRVVLTEILILLILAGLAIVSLAGFGPNPDIHSHATIRPTAATWGA